MKLKYLTKNPSQTKKLGELLAKKFLKEKKQKGARVLGLEGELGGGKTTFLQGLAKGLGIKEKITSPTFVIMKKFRISTKTYNLKPKTFVHIDCYRIEKPKEILDLGFKEIISDSQNLVAIEWSDKIKKIFPKNSTILKFNFVSKNQREIIIIRKK
jgi:tRNA threonylcarbamoyladenosine biosynthesis protein TsaE